jgi:hypothetical protein
LRDRSVLDDELGSAGNTLQFVIDVVIALRPRGRLLDRLGGFSQRRFELCR